MYYRLFNVIKNNLNELIINIIIETYLFLLFNRMISPYTKLVDMQYIDCLVDIFENPIYTESNELLPFFVKFELITMQSLTVILGDVEYSQLWSDKAKYVISNKENFMTKF
jgi:hypothetical protein